MATCHKEQSARFTASRFQVSYKVTSFRPICVHIRKADYNCSERKGTVLRSDSTVASSNTVLKLTEYKESEVSNVS